MTIFEKLKLKIDKDLEINAFDFRRTYAGYWQRTAGSWLWHASVKWGDIGSQIKATELVKAKNKLIMDHNGEIYLDESK